MQIMTQPQPPESKLEYTKPALPDDLEDCWELIRQLTHDLDCARTRVKVLEGTLPF